VSDLPIAKPADLIRLRKAKRAQHDAGEFMKSINNVFNGMIDQLRAEKAKNKRLRAKIAELLKR
jgi:transposase-like protein